MLYKENTYNFGSWTKHIIPNPHWQSWQKLFKKKWNMIITRKKKSSVDLEVVVDLDPAFPK